MDSYSILGLERGASPEDVKRAFRRLVKIYHPDVGGDPEKFKEISSAYRVIMESFKTGGQTLENNGKKRRFRFSILDRFILKTPAKAIKKVKNLYEALKSPVDPKVLNLPLEELVERFMLSRNMYVKFSAIKAIYIKDSSLARKLLTKGLDRGFVLKLLIKKWARATTF